MMTKCLADKSLIRNPVAKIVKFERIVKRVEAKFARFEFEVAKIGSKIILKVVAKAVLKI